jgi:hypothetical protein
MPTWGGNGDKKLALSIQTLFISLFDMNSLELNNKNLLSKCLVVAVLVLSFFTFSGIVVQNQVKLGLSHTEAAYNSEKPAVRIIAWQRALKQMQSLQRRLSVFASSTIDLAYFDNLRVKILYINTTAKVTGKLQNSTFHQRKTIPAHKNDEPSIAFV